MEIRKLIARNEMIEAIARYRAATHTDLKTAKDAVFAFRERLRERGLI